MKSIGLTALFFAVLVWAGSSFAQGLHPEGKFNFLRGREAFQKGDYKAAIGEFKTYMKLDRDNYQVLNFLGQAYHQLKNTEQAAAYYKRAIELAPANTYAPLYSFNLGVLYYEQKNYKEALPLFSRAADKIPVLPMDFAQKKGLAYYYKAFIYYNREEWETAKHNFERSTKYSKQLRQGAWFYYAICELKLGHFSKSVDRFKLVERIGTSKALTEYSKQFISQLEGHKPEAETGFSWLTGFGSIYDTNVFLEPEEGKSHSSIQDEKGETISLFFEPSYRTPVKSWNFLGKVNLSAGYQLERRHSKYDYFSYRGNAVFSKNFSSATVNQLSFDTRWLFARGNGHRFVESLFDEVVSWLHGWSSYFLTDFQLSGGLSDFPSTGDAKDDRNGWTAGVSVLNSFKVPGTDFTLRAGAGVSRSDTRGGNFDADVYMLTGGVNFLLGKSVTLDLSVRHDRNEYDARRTTTTTTTLSFFKSWTSQLFSSIGISRVDGRGTPTTAYDYTRDIYMLNLFYQI